VERIDPARAELARLDVQVRSWERERLLAKLQRGDESPWPPECKAISKRAHALRVEHADRWREEITACDLETPYWGFQLGFWQTLWTDAKRFARHGAETLAMQGTASIRLSGADKLERALQGPAIQQIRSLAIETPVDSDLLAALLSSVELANCEQLELHSSSVALEKLVAIPWIRALTSFRGIGRDLEDVSEDAPTATRTWRSRFGAVLEAQWGSLPFLHNTIWKTASYHSRAFLTKWLVAQGAELPPPPANFAGEYRRAEFTCSDGEFQLVTAVLERAGYKEGAYPRGYSVAKDGAPGWGGWMYWVDGREFSDALWIDEVENILRR